MTHRREQIALHRNGEITVGRAVEAVRADAGAVQRAARQRRAAQVAEAAIGRRAGAQRAQAVIGIGPRVIVGVIGALRRIARQIGLTRGRHIAAEEDLADVVDIRRAGLGGVVALEDSALLGIAHEQGDVAATVGEVGAEDSRGVEVEVIARLRDAALGIELQALEILLEDEVDDACNGIRTVNGRCAAARQNFDALDQRRRDSGEVHRVATGHARDVTTAVDEHEGAVDAEIAQVDRRDAGARRIEGVGGAAVGRRTEGRVLEELVLDVDDTRLLNRRGRDHLNGSDRDIRTRLDARSGHDDGFAFLSLVGVLRLLRKCRRRQQGEAENRRCGRDLQQC